jgi:hypothetical protein
VGSRRPKRTTGEVLARLHTRAAGLYAVAFEAVFPGRRRGLSASQLRLERQGEAVAFHVEPGGDVFGPGSRLFFHAEREAGSSEFSGETAYELVASREGVRMAQVSAAPWGAAVGTAARVGARFEQNRYYQPGLLEAEDLWQWEPLGSGTTRMKGFTLVGVAASATGTAELEVELQGASESGRPLDHHVSVALNGVAVGEVQFAGKKPQRLSLSVPVSLLSEGANELALTNVADTGVSSLVFLDRFALVYPQAGTLQGGRFEGTWDESGTVTLSGLTGAAVVVDVTGSGTGGTATGTGTTTGTGTPVWLTGFERTAGSVRLRVEMGHRYRVESDSALLSPRVAAAQPSGLRSAVNQADYLLIAPRAFLAAAEPLVARRQQQGLSARAVAFEEIAEVFAHGQPSAQAIRSFLAYAFHSWARPSPRYVLLLGDSTYDPQRFVSSSPPSPLPALWAKTSYLWTASDPTLGAVNGEDALPDLAIGRLPAGTPEQAQTLVQKLIAWEDSGQDLLGPVALVADNPDLAGDFAADVDDVAASFPPGRELRVLKLAELGATTRGAIRDALDSGLGYLGYVGHGGAAVWASENVWNSWDAASLLPQSRQPLLVTMNCLNGYFVAPAFESLAESLLKVEGRGAVAAFSPSGLSLDGPAHQYHQALVRQLTSEKHLRLGDAVLEAQREYAASGLMPELLAVYHLFADPAMSLR